MSRRNLLFAVAQDALKGRPTSASVIEDLHAEIWDLCDGDYTTEIVATALMYPALLGLPAYRSALESALMAVHSDNDHDRNLERAKRKYGSEG